MSLDRRAMADALPNYEIGRELGRGAFGIVYEGHHRHLERRVAIKQLPRALAADPTSLTRFITEAKTAAALQHPSIVPVYDFTEKDGLCLLVMEHLGGGSLAERATRAPLTTADACRVAVDIADALHYAHGRGVLHRDVKPENVIFTDDGDAKLADFGIAKLLEQPDRLTMTGTVVGTPAYLAPEVAMGDDATPASDVYSLGVLLYELLARQLPFPARATTAAMLLQRVSEDPTPIGDLVPDLDAGLADVVMRSIARDPAQRYASAALVADALRPFAATAGATGPSPSAAGVPTAAPQVTPAPTAAPRVPLDPGTATAAPRLPIGPGASDSLRTAAAAVADLPPSVAPSRRRGRAPLLVAAAVVAVLAVVVAVLLSGGDDETAVATDPGSTPTTSVAVAPSSTGGATATTVAGGLAATTVAPSSTLPPGLATVTEATVRFREGCTTLYTGPQCDCAIDRIQRELGLVAFVDIAKDLERDRRINRPQAVAIMAQCAATR